jgi:hypothetical protein
VTESPDSFSKHLFLSLFLLVHAHDHQSSVHAAALPFAVLPHL